MKQMDTMRQRDRSWKKERRRGDADTALCEPPGGVGPQSCGEGPSVDERPVIEGEREGGARTDRGERRRRQMCSNLISLAFF